MIQGIISDIVVAFVLAGMILVVCTIFAEMKPADALEVSIQVPTWEIETEIFDAELLTGVVLRNTDKRDVLGAGGQLLISGDADTIELLLNELQLER